MSLFRRRFTPAGSSPGTVTPDADAEPSTLSLAVYDSDVLIEEDPARWPSKVVDERADRIAWFDVRGLSDTDLIQRIGEQLGVHPLAVSDAINVGQRPKIDAYGDDLFAVVRSISVGPDGLLAWEQVGVAMTATAVATFQESSVDSLAPVRKRLREGRPRLRGGGVDYLTCALIDAVVDNYFPVLDHYGSRIEEVEEQVLTPGEADEMTVLYGLRRDLTAMRRGVWPLREALGQLLRDPDSPISPEVRPFLRDTFDHCQQVLDVIDSFRELAAGLVELHLALVGQRTNDVMRTLTIVSTIFIPLTFLAGIFGMNFDTSSPWNQPELGWRFGYLAFWFASALLALGLLLLFRRIGWLGSAPPVDPDR